MNSIKYIEDSYYKYTLFGKHLYFKEFNVVTVIILQEIETKIIDSDSLYIIKSLKKPTQDVVDYVAETPELNRCFVYYNPGLPLSTLKTITIEEFNRHGR